MFSWLSNWWARRAEATMFERDIIVVDDAGTISATYPDGTVSSVEWTDLVQIEVRTNDSGPWGSDVWWVLTGRNSECVYPQGATGDPEMIPKYQAMDGFDDEELIKAMGCTSNRSFLCWKNFVDWTEMEIFTGVDLSASYITECSQSDAQLTVILQASLWKESSFYEPLKEDEHVCYKKAELNFMGFTSIEGLDNLLSQARINDRQGRPDFGEIEEFEQTERGFRLLGKFGEVTIVGGSFSFAIHT